MILIVRVEDPDTGEYYEDFFAGEWKWKEVPALSRETDPFELLLQLQSLDVSFLWDPDGTTRWDEFLTDSRKYITGIEIYNDEHDTLYFSGDIEPESEICASNVDHEVKLSFINSNYEMLNETTALTTIDGSFYYCFYYVLDDLGWLSSCDYPGEAEWLHVLPVQLYAEDTYADLNSLRYYFDFTDMTKADVLKTILGVGFAQIFIYDESQKIMNYLLPSGGSYSNIRILSDTYTLKRFTIELTGLDHVYLSMYSLPGVSKSKSDVESIISDYYDSSFTYEKYEMSTKDAAPGIGEVFQTGGERYMCTKWKPDFRFLGAAECPIELTGLLMVRDD